MKRAVITLALLALGQAHGQAAGDSVRPFVPGGVYDKPFQGRLLGRTAIGGYAEAHARYERVDGLRGRARRQHGHRLGRPGPFRLSPADP